MAKVQIKSGENHSFWRKDVPLFTTTCSFSEVGGQRKSTELNTNYPQRVVSRLSSSNSFLSRPNGLKHPESTD